MNTDSNEFTLSFTNEPKPLLLDEDPVTTKWPLPEPRAWDSAPTTLTLWERIALWFDFTLGWMR